jgi:hypothetical protein
MSKYLTKQQSGMVRVVARQLSAQMDASCLAAATQRLVAFCVEDGPLPNAAKDASFLVEGLAYANPAAVLPVLLPALLEGVVVVEGGGSWRLGTVSARVLAWRLRLLRGAVRYGGRALLPFAEALQAAVRHTLGHEDGSVAGAGAKCLKALLSGLAETYPLDYRSAPHGDTWASVAVAWHECSAEEASLAAALLEEHLLLPLQDLARGGTRAADGPSHKRAAAWKASLGSAHACLRGGAALLHDHDPRHESGDDGAQGLPTGSAAVRFGGPLALVGLRQRAAAAAADAHAHLWGPSEEGTEGLGPHRAVLTAEWIKVAGALLGQRGGAMAHLANRRRFISRHLSLQLSSPAAATLARVHNDSFLPEALGIPVASHRSPCALRVPTSAPWRRVRRPRTRRRSCRRRGAGCLVECSSSVRLRTSWRDTPRPSTASPSPCATPPTPR